METMMLLQKKRSLQWLQAFLLLIEYIDFNFEATLKTISVD